MRYFDKHKEKEISEKELLEIVDQEISFAFDVVESALSGKAVFDDGLSYYGDKYICENLGFYDAETDQLGVIRIPLDSSVDDSNHEKIIAHAKKHILNWNTLKCAILHHAKNGWPMAKPYWDLLEDLVFDRVKKVPKDGRYKKTELDYLAYMIAAKCISERFGIKLTRGYGSDKITSALDLVSQSEKCPISFETLRRDAYPRYGDAVKDLVGFLAWPYRGKLFFTSPSAS